MSHLFDKTRLTIFLLALSFLNNKKFTHFERTRDAKLLLIEPRFVPLAIEISFRRFRRRSQGLNKRSIFEMVQLKRDSKHPKTMCFGGRGVKIERHRVISVGLLGMSYSRSCHCISRKLLTTRYSDSKRYSLISCMPRVSSKKKQPRVKSVALKRLAGFRNCTICGLHRDETSAQAEIQVYDINYALASICINCQSTVKLITHKFAIVSFHHRRAI